MRRGRIDGSIHGDDEDDDDDAEDPIARDDDRARWDARCVRSRCVRTVDDDVTRASSEAVSNESRGADAVRYDDGDIPREVGRASKEELGKWLESRRLPTQKMALEVNLAEGEGWWRRRRSRGVRRCWGVNRGTIITVRRALEEAKLGPRHAELQEWSILATFLAQQALALERGEAGTFGEYIRALPRRTGSVLDWPEDEVDKLLAGSPSRLAAAERQGERPTRRSMRFGRTSRKSPSGRCDGRSTFYSVV